jgi:transposase-like protein
MVKLVCVCGEVLEVGEGSYKCPKCGRGFTVKQLSRGVYIAR